jgi:hypothetical protein
MAKDRAAAKTARRQWEPPRKDSSEFPDIFNVKPRIAAATGEIPAAQHIFSRILEAAQSEGGISHRFPDDALQLCLPGNSPLGADKLYGARAIGPESFRTDPQQGRNGTNYTSTSAQ